MLTRPLLSPGIALVDFTGFKALGHVGRVIATTFESLDVLRERYSEIDETIAELEKHFSEVYHATWLTELTLAGAFRDLSQGFCTSQCGYCGLYAFEGRMQLGEIDPKEVDCTRIAVHSQFKNLEGSLGAVYYNFPHAGQESGGGK